MMKSKFWFRFILFFYLGIHFCCRPFQKRKKPQTPQRILVLHSLLFGDAVMVTPLLKALRLRFPQAKITLALSSFLESIFKNNPYQIECIGWDMRHYPSFFKLKKEAPFDLALLPAENRLSLLCRAIGVAWVRGFENDKAFWMNLGVDEKIPLPSSPTAFCDMVVKLCPAPIPEVFFEGEWQSNITPPRNLMWSCTRGQVHPPNFGKRSAGKWWRKLYPKKVFTLFLRE